MTSLMFQAIESFSPVVLFVCHGESSTGTCHPLEGLGELCHRNGCLLLVDTVASLGGAPFEADKLGVDCVYSGSQKVLNAPPGSAPISFSDKAIEKIKSRKQQVPSFYFDALEIGNYWGCDQQPRRYHHTAPMCSIYALREALATVIREGIDECIERHLRNSEVLTDALHSIGLSLFVKNPNFRLPCLTTVRVPDDIKWNAITADLMMKGIEIGGGLGPTVGKVWRIGTFGVNSNEEKIKFLVTELDRSIKASRSSENTSKLRVSK
ncbi:hypothetical protein AB6A40_009649 [Gnathostoma spinigerum]|uniref:Aminotransferase class V domain-containing protein n=1 Tax=Gnathostoma spinigerum TaxID=75299 RepID=A0ABD6ESJ9_9BILA